LECSNKAANKTNIMTTLNLNITALEEKVLTIISQGDEYEETPTECFDTILDSFNGTKNELKGVLGSLYKKELIWIGEFPNGLSSYHLNQDNI
jgi:hypothetical protein